MGRVSFLRRCQISSDIFRTAVEDEIERLLALLDRLDGDPDAEPDGADEPYLGWSTGMGLGDRHDLEANEVAA